MPPALLAVSTTVSIPIEPSAVYIAMSVAALLVLIPAFDSLTRIINFFRAKPPLHEQFATKKELKAAEERLTAIMSADGADLAQVETRMTATRSEMETRLTTQINEVKTSQTSMGRELTSIASQLGRLFGMLEGREPH
jgi:hypothetical protein